MDRHWVYRHRPDRLRRRHRVADGFTGPSTRERLVSELFHQFTPGTEEYPTLEIDSFHYLCPKGKECGFLELRRDHDSSVTKDIDEFEVMTEEALVSKLHEIKLQITPTDIDDFSLNHLITLLPQIKDKYNRRKIQRLKREHKPTSS